MWLSISKYVEQIFSNLALNLMNRFSDGYKTFWQQRLRLHGTIFFWAFQNNFSSSLYWQHPVHYAINRIRKFHSNLIWTKVQWIGLLWLRITSLYWQGKFHAGINIMNSTVFKSFKIRFDCNLMNRNRKGLKICVFVDLSDER